MSEPGHQPVLVENFATTAGLGFHAAGRYSLISPANLARSWIRAAGTILVNEINTMPGMTPASGFPMMWAASGLPLPQLVDRIIQTALRKRPGPAWRP